MPVVAPGGILASCYSPAMLRARLTAVRIVMLGATCFAVGLGLGAAWRSQPESIWREPEPLRSVSVLPTFAEVVEQVGPAVVTVRAQLRPLPVGELATPRRRYRNGSGFLVHADGLIVTSRHVVDGAVDIEVIVPKRGSFKADLVGEDTAADLAMLRLPSSAGDLPVLPIGRSEDLRAGDWIVAVGNPFGFAQTVTHGVVSFVGRNLHHSDFGVTNDFLQISAPVNPGSSGCPVVDLLGRVVGVTTQAPTESQGISFAVPSRTLKWALEEMERRPDGRVRRGYLGIEFAPWPGLDERGVPKRGALIVDVIDGEPAARAGLKAGDVVLRVDGEPVPDARALHDRIVRGEPGSRLALLLLRNGVIHDPIVAVLGEVGAPKAPDSAN